MDGMGAVDLHNDKSSLYKLAARSCKAGAGAFHGNKEGGAEGLRPADQLVRRFAGGGEERSAEKTDHAEDNRRDRVGRWRSQAWSAGISWIITVT